MLYMLVASNLLFLICGFILALFASSCRRCGCTDTKLSELKMYKHYKDEAAIVPADQSETGGEEEYV